MIFGMLCGNVLAHLELQTPPPRLSRFNPFATARDIDYNMVAPLEADGSNFPCKNYPASEVVAEFNAGKSSICDSIDFNLWFPGDSISVAVSGSVFHGGGHCQFSISYNDRDFVAIHTVLRDCFVGTGSTFAIDIPDSIPACDKCTFSWTWVNAVGNRELYMNCADIKINNPSGAEFLEGPQMVVANLPGYPTIPEFPPSEDDGSSLYASAPNIRISPDDALPISSPVSSVVASTDLASLTTSNIADTTTGIASSPAPSPPTTCVEGESKCASAGSWLLCSNDVFYTLQCPPGTVCVETSGSALCGLPGSVADTSLSSAPATTKTTDMYSGAPSSATTADVDPVIPSASPTPSTTCVGGESKCTSSGSWLLCSNGVFYTLQCPPGTVCVETNGVAQCDISVIVAVSTASSSQTPTQSISRPCESHLPTTADSSGTDLGPVANPTQTSGNQVPTNERCSSGQSRCEGEYQWALCSFGIWYVRDCPSSLKCYDKSGYAMCNY
jgi:hypothetical protein